MEVSRLTTCSVRAAREVTSLMVEHGVNPLVSPSFWLTMVRMRPLVGSTTTTLPFMLPRAATAERLTVRSSPSTLSPSVGSTAGGAFRTGLRAGADFLVADEGLDFLIWALAGAAFWSKPTRSSGKRTNPFICGAFRQLTDSLSAIAEPLVNGQSATFARGSREPPTWPSDPYPSSLRRHKYTCLSERGPVHSGLGVSHFVASPEPLVIRLYSFFDDAGTDGTSPFTVCAGYLSTAWRWRQFEKKWRHLLRSYHIPASRFSMKDCAQFRGPFTGWDEPKRRAFMAHALELIQRCVQHGFVADLINSEYDILLSQGVKRRVGGYYPFCAEMCIGITEQYIAKVEGRALMDRPRSAIHYIFESGTHGAGKVQTAFEEYWGDP